MVSACSKYWLFCFRFFYVSVKLYFRDRLWIRKCELNNLHLPFYISILKHYAVIKKNVTHIRILCSKTLAFNEIFYKKKKSFRSIIQDSIAFSYWTKFSDLIWGTNIVTGFFIVPQNHQKSDLTAVTICSQQMPQYVITDSL